MCGIVGNVGYRPACDVVIDALRRMEYRGYDSAGVALVNGDGGLTVRMRLSAATASVHSGDGSRDARGARTGTEGTSPGGRNNLEQDRGPVTRVAAVLAHV